MDVPKGERLVIAEFEISADQQRWLEATAKRAHETPDALIREAIQVLRRVSAYRPPASRSGRPRRVSDT